MNIMNVCSDHSGSLHWRCKFSCLIPFCMCCRLLLSTWLCISQSNCRISLIRNGDRIPSHEQVVIQEYIDRVSYGSICHQSNLSFVWFFAYCGIYTFLHFQPFLLEGFKFDLRVYVLVTSCDPLRIFLYHDGLVGILFKRFHS